MNQQEQTSSTNRRKRSRKHGKGSSSSHSFMKGKSSSVPLAEQSADKQKKIVSWGKNNLYPYFLNYLFKNNPIHSGIIRSKQIYTTSGGLVYDGQDVAEWDIFFKNGKTNPNEQNLQEVVEDMSLDLEKSNLFLLHGFMNIVGEKKDLRKIIPIPFERFRFGVDTEDGKDYLTGNIKVSDDWSDVNCKIVELSPYKPLDMTQREFFVLYMEKPSQSIDYTASKKINPSIYPDPPYCGGITDIETGIQISKHGNAEIHNGFSLGTVLNLNNGRPSNEEEKKRLEASIGDAATGSDNTGGILTLYGNGKDREASVTTLNGNNLPERYLNVKKSGVESVIHAHSVVAPTLFGIMQEGSFNADQLEGGYAIMQGNYFTSRRNTLTSYLNWIGKTFFGLQGEIKFGDKPLNLPKPLANPQFVVNTNEVPKEKEIHCDHKSKLTKEDHEKIISRFKSCGKSKKDFTIVHSISLTDSSEAYEMSIMDDFVKSFYKDLPDNVNQALNLIKQGESFNSIRTALDISGTQLAGIYKKLQDLKMISIEGKVLAKGIEQLVASDIDAMEILYEYRLKPNAPELKPGGAQKSRPFCVEVLGLDRLYTRDEISSISGAEGYDVFNYRGGWYHNWETDINQPSCRHEWNQVIVFNN